MEIVIKAKKKKSINRSRCGDGIIRIDSESADLLEGFYNKIGADISIKELASILIKTAIDNAVIRVIDEEE